MRTCSLAHVVRAGRIGQRSQTRRYELCRKQLLALLSQYFLAGQRPRLPRLGPGKRPTAGAPILG
jgi:hypothetical protein